MGTFWTTICSPHSMGNSAPPSATLCVATCRTTLVAGHHRCVGWRPGATHGRNRGFAGLRGEPHPISSTRGHHGGSSLRGLWGLSSKRSWRSMTHARTKPCPVLPPHSLPLLLSSSLPSLTRPMRKAIFYGKTCSRALSQHKRPAFLCPSPRPGINA